MTDVPGAVAAAHREEWARIVGALTGLIVVMKGLPLAYAKDMQEDKEGAFDALHALSLCLAATAGMVRDMRNRFWVSLAFTIPLFVWMPMGLPLPSPQVPFGLRMDQWLLVLASGAVLWPSWPFFVAFGAYLLWTALFMVHLATRRYRPEQ